MRCVISSARPERTGWRDESLSRRHRTWGYHLPAVDLDLLLVECDKGEPVALIEYKNARAVPCSPTSPSMRALRRLGDRAGLPVLGCRYADDLTEFLAVPLNDRARAVLPERRRMTEPEWVALLHRLRNRTSP